LPTCPVDLGENLRRSSLKRNPSLQFNETDLAPAPVGGNLRRGSYQVESRATRTVLDDFIARLIIIIKANYDSPNDRLTKEIYDEDISNDYPSLTADSLHSFLKKDKQAQIDGIALTAQNVTCNLWSYNCRIGGVCGASGCVGICCIVSDPELIISGEEPDDESHCIDINDGPAGTGPGLPKVEEDQKDLESYINKRALTNKLFTWKGLGVSQVIYYSISAWEGGGSWHPQSSIYYRVFDFMNERDCSDSAITTIDPVRLPILDPYEHWYQSMYTSSNKYADLEADLK